MLRLLIFVSLSLPLLAQTGPPQRPDLVSIPAGTFVMGDRTGKGKSDETPLRSVTIARPFQMAVTEVTQAQWEAVMGSNSSYNKGPQHPVEMITWFHCIEYCNRLSRQEGLTPCYSGSEPDIFWDTRANGYRLPTEAEWEYAARAGTTSDFSAGTMTEGNCALDPVLDLIGWYCGNASKSSHDVGRKHPNPWGLYDMHGNVTEWCWDWYAPYHTEATTDPLGPRSGTERVFRGGSWYDPATDSRSSARSMASPGGYGLLPQRGYGMHGFRIVRGAVTTGMEFPSLPEDMCLSSPSPQPCGERTSLTLVLPQATSVFAVVTDLVGRTVSTLMDQYLPAGTHVLTWTADRVPAGIYLCRVRTHQRVLTRILVKQ